MSDTSRTWFRYSLRSMFVVVTIVCCFLAWESSVVRQRQAELRILRSRPGVQVMTAQAWAAGFDSAPLPRPQAKVSFIRRCLGDEAIQEISHDRVFDKLSQDEIDRIARIFPEAKLREHERLMEPCHPGCFPRGTPVETPDGPRAIEDVRPGDTVVTIDAGGNLVPAIVQSVFTTTNELCKIETVEGVLFTTKTQPLCVSLDQTIPAGEVAAGDVLLRCTGGNVHAVRVLAASSANRTERVFNLVLGNREHFIAAGFLARSKPPSD